MMSRQFIVLVADRDLAGFEAAPPLSRMLSSLKVLEEGRV